MNGQKCPWAYFKTKKVHPSHFLLFIFSSSVLLLLPCLLFFFFLHHFLRRAARSSSIFGPAVEAALYRQDVPAASVEGLADAIADDVAEGFPGGPHDPSVLTSFGDHVAHRIWMGEEHPDLRLASHGRKVEKIGRPSPEIEGLVAAIGLSPLIGCSIVTGNPGLISALVKRWHGETSSFHLPMGELTITLDDVSLLLHLPITDTLHNFEPLVVEEAVVLLMELLEVLSQEVRAETA
ncbi:uncharacterized protein [Glycine max]|uniref:uncharacterized protein n=1 Tax=Glycine max TaxID=3847 RepID=UPI0003DE7D56|nr:uncharacterized protein LOC102661726 [Glycine max]XP_040868097.1 uncharacterized protein LOC102661726 [Glycine max]XP_040868098.1 uncharacterized protein LOC102661726 [Glycine max]XP_040868099.1 uncharacterized protein LOC102661726 [Glycine max]XP_040868100.1 uncharacterized protein LOC102661726 [Glycine max]XP_040868101.1 uncharacterized protein LOC102661726 [Glycine max]